MKRHFTFLMAAFALMVSMMMPLGMKGQTSVTLFSETFSSCDGTGGNDNLWDGNIASSDIHTDNTGWSFSKEFGAYKCAKFGTGSAKGVATTPSISFTGNATLTFKAGAWNGSSEKTTLAISATGGTLKQNGNTINSVTMVKGAWTTYTVDVVGVTSSVKITFQGSQASNNRFFLDEIVVSQVASVVATPTFSPAAGSFDSPQNVTISCATENATIYYTTDGTMPTTSSTTYSSAIAVSSTTTIKAIAVKEGMSNSAVATATYTIESSGGDGTIYTIYTGNLIEGDYIIYYSGKAMKNTVSSNRLQYESITPSGNTITTSNDAIIWHIAPSGDYWTIYNEAVGKFAASTGNENKAQLLDSGTDDMSLWTVEGNSTYEFVNKKNAANNVNKNLRNNGQYGFACYGTGIGGALSLYRSTSPSIVVNQTIELAQDATSGSFGYSITNPVEGTNLQAISNAEWITNVTVGTEQVTFTATANTTGVERTGTITLQYDGAQDKTVAVTQAAIAPVLETTNIPSTPFDYTGSTGSFDFTITNPVDDATITATSTNAWITNVTVSGNTVNFQVAQNDGLARSGEITLAYARNGTTFATATVTINQDSNPVQPGSADNPYTVAQAVSATPSSGTSGLIYVKGIVSEIIEIEVMQYHNARYHISDDGSTSSTQLLAFYGRNINNTDFLSEDELLVGDSVVICGQLQMYNHEAELGAGNYIVYLHRDIDPVTFSPVSCVTTSGTYVSLYSNVYDEWDAEIYYTTDGSEPSHSNGTYYDVWGGDLITLTQTTTIKAVAYVPDLDKYSTITQATYTIVDPSIPGWVGNPYTVSQAIAAIDNASSHNIKGAYVQGIISRISQIELEQYFNATYFISDNGLEQNELQVYRGKYLSQGDFSSLDDIQVGDQVIVYGDLTLFNNTTHEFKPKNYIYDLQRSSSIIINQNHLDVDCNATAGTIAISYSADLQVNIDSPTVQLCDAQGNAASYDWLSVSLNQDDEWNLEYTINANDGASSRTAYLKVSCQNVVSNLVTITQNEYQCDFATLPFTFDGGRAAAENITGLKPANLGKDYNSSPKLKFHNPTVDGNIMMSSLVLKINEVPGVLTFDIKGNNFSGGTFKVQASADGVVYSDMATYRTISSETQTKTINNLPTNTRYIRWIYVTKSSGNVAVGNIHLARPVVKYKINCEQPYYAGTQVGTITANKADAFEGETITLNAMPNNGYVFLEWSVVEYNSNQAVAVADSSATTTTFLMPYDSVTVSAVIVPDNTEYQYAYSINGTVGQLQTATIGTMLTLPAGSGISGQPFTFVGWTTNPNNVENVMLAGASYRLLRDVTFYAVYVESVAGSSADKHYVRVTEDFAQNWAGDYLIAYSSAIFADGRVSGTTSGGIGCANVSVAPGNNLHDNMVETIWGDIYRVTLEEVAAGSDTYLLKTQDGNYNYYTNNNGNGLSATANRDVADDYPITVNFVSANDIRLSLGGDAEGSVFRYNPQGFFRFYKNCGQEPVYLYKKTISTDNRYTRVFVNMQASANLVIEGPSIVPSGQVLNVTTITNNLGADRLVIAEGGQLVTANDVNATIRRFVNFYQGEYDNYYLISTPVDGQDPVDAGMTGGEYDLYAFDQSEQGEEWQNYEANEFATLESGKGYLYANNYGGFIKMSGLMDATADDVTVDYVSGKNFAGWNLIGNPYPCNVTIGTPFYRLAEGGAALATVATDNSVAIAPMEGVFVYADEENDITFTKASNVSTTGNGRNVINMRVRRNDVTKGGCVESDNAIVRFGEGSLLRKLVLNPDLPQIYVAQDGADYAIVNAEAEGELPISFRAAENGNYTISVNAEEVSFGYLHLIDNKTGVNVDLLQTNNYTFDANTADYACRFKLVFATNSICEDVDGGNETFAYFNGSAWVVNGVDGGAILQVVDMTGRVILSNDAKAGISVNAMSQGIYVLRLIDGDNVKIQKIINK